MRNLMMALMLGCWPLGAAALTICHENEQYAPYTLWTETNPDEHTGVLVDMVRLAAAAINQPVEFVARPWKRCIQDLKEGRVDGIFSMIWLPEREQIGVFPKPEGWADQAPSEAYRLWRVQYPFFINRNRVRSISWDGTKLTGLKHGFSALNGYVAQQRLEAAGWLAPGTVSLDAGLKLIALNRLDGYVVETAIGRQRLHDLGLVKEIEPLPIPFMGAVWYLPLSHSFYQQQPELAWAFWAALAKVRDEQGTRLMTEALPGSHLVP